MSAAHEKRKAEINARGIMSQGGSRNIVRIVVAGALLALGLAVMLPATAGDLQSHANPAHTFADAEARARGLIATDGVVAAPGGATILLTHDRRTAWAAVLFHGFTDSPRQFAPLADSLFRSGYNVLVPRLPRHAERGRNVRELAGLTPSELRGRADTAIDIAAGLGDSVVVMGLSLGGTLATWAAERRAEVKRAIIIAPAFEIARVPADLDRPLENLEARLPNISRPLTDSANPDRDPGLTTRGLDAVLRLGGAVRDDADRFTPSAQVIFVVNAHDHTVKTAPVVHIATLWRRRGVPVVVYEFPDSLGLFHNVIDPMRPASSAASPVLLNLARGEAPPRWLRPR